MTRFKPLVTAFVGKKRVTVLNVIVDKGKFVRALVQFPDRKCKLIERKEISDVSDGWEMLEM